MREKEIIVNTQGSYSPGIVQGDYTVINYNIYNCKAVSTEGISTQIDPYFTKNLGVFKTLVSASKNESYKELILYQCDNLAKGRIPTPYETAIIGRNLLLETVDRQDWSSRRALSYILGDSLSKIQERKKRNEILKDLLEIVKKSEDGQILLASTISQHIQVCSGQEEIIQRLLEAEHPQIGWEVLHKYNNIYSIFNDNLLTDVLIGGLSNTWRRKGLLGAMCVSIARNKDILTPVHQIILEKSIDAEMRYVGDRYIYLLQAFCHSYFEGSPIDNFLDVRKNYYTCLFQSWRKADRNLPSFSNLEKYLEIMALEELGCADLIVDVAFMEEQLINKQKQKQISATGNYGELRDKLIRMIAQGSWDRIKELVKGISCSQEEGVRWACASVLPLIFSKDTDLHFELFVRLINDEYHWVIREVISSLSQIENIGEAKKIKEILNVIMRKIESLKKGNRSIAVEVSQPFMEFLARNRALIVHVGFTPLEA